MPLVRFGTEADDGAAQIDRAYADIDRAYVRLAGVSGRCWRATIPLMSIETNPHEEAREAFRAATAILREASDEIVPEEQPAERPAMPVVGAACTDPAEAARCAPAG